MGDVSSALSSAPLSTCSQLGAVKTEYAAVIAVGVGRTGWASLTAMLKALPAASDLTFLIATPSSFQPSEEEKSELARVSHLPLSTV